MGQPKFHDIGVAVGGILVLGHGWWVGEREPDVVGGCATEVADYQLDHVPVRDVGLHKHGHVGPSLLRSQSTIALDLPLGHHQGDHTEPKRRPRGPRQPGAGVDAGDLMPAAQDPPHGIHHPLIPQ
ncbi:Uncharacterised protein [Mycobacterium tuberculosis]|nr:Uncharacterised protein [Mycobacterium tuberculosis]